MSGRSAAVRIGSQVPYLLVEARQRVDQFDRNIPGEGVIVYRVNPHRDRRCTDFFVRQIKSDGVDADMTANSGQPIPKDSASI